MTDETLENKVERLQQHVARLESLILRQAGEWCFKCRFGVEPYRDGFGFWKHEGTRGCDPQPCNASHMWDILKPKDRPDPTHVPVNGDGGV